MADAEPITWEYYERAERDIFRLSGLPDECIQRSSVPIGKDCHGVQLTVRTAVVRAETDTETTTKPTFVWVHGYGGQSGMYQQVLWSMTKFFRVILIDMLGCGASSRPKSFKYQSMTA